MLEKPSREHLTKNKRVGSKLTFILSAECDMTFKQTGALTYHTFVAHAQLQDRPHKCAVCPESFLAAHHLQVRSGIARSSDKTQVVYQQRLSLGNGYIMRS